MYISPVKLTASPTPTKPRHLDRRRRFCRRSGEIPVFRLCRCFSSTASFPQPNLVKPRSPHLLIPQSDTCGVLVLSGSYNRVEPKKAPVHDRGFSHWMHLPLTLLE